MIIYNWNTLAESIGYRFIEQHHQRLQKIGIAYLFKETQTTNPKAKTLRSGKKEVWAKASKVPDKYIALMEQAYRFVIEFDRDIWEGITLEQQEALVDQKLCCCGNDENGCYMRSHDLEEFREIVQRHGLWKDDVRAFAEVANKQLSLFEITRQTFVASTGRS